MRSIKILALIRLRYKLQSTFVCCAYLPLGKLLDTSEVP